MREGPLVARSKWASLGIALALVAACTSARDEPAPTFREEIRPIFASKCDKCHASQGAGGFATTSYLATIACNQAGTPLTLPGDETSPLLVALSSSSHREILTPEERATVARWLSSGTRRSKSRIHPDGFADPRSTERHGAALRAKRWAPMLDPSNEGACGRCHDGTPSGRPEKVVSSAIGATSCTTCHTGERGPLECTTCHGGEERSAPPRDPCFFPAPFDAHPSHVRASASRAEGLTCATCHPSVSEIPGTGSHGNGTVDVVFDPVSAGSGSWDGASRACTTACHARGGTMPNPTWHVRTAMTCSSCHATPPAGHYVGACTECHEEANRDGTSLALPKLHANGAVDLGDGTRKCGSCHGNGDDPLPKSGAHAAHAKPKAAAEVPCSSCHVVPNAFGTGTGHPTGGGAVVAFSGRAVRSSPASYANGTCTDVACHGAGLLGTVARTPNWLDTSGTEAACGSCHGLPPSAPHTSETQCDTCHAGVAKETPSGFVVVDPARHANGVVDR